MRARSATPQTVVAAALAAVFALALTAALRRTRPTRHDAG